MEMMTAEQAAEAAKGLTFEKVWAALMESRRSMEELKKRMKESDRELKKRMKESDRELKKRMEESDREFKKRMEESDRELKKRMDASQKRIEKNLGDMGNSIGLLTESMFTNELWKKFRDFGIPVTEQVSHRKFGDDEIGFAEVDVFMENGEYAIAVEIKTKMTIERIDDHLDRIEIVRRHMDKRGDARKLLGAVGCGTIYENEIKYAQKKGLYVVIQSGDSVAIADAPKSFRPREW